jgi:hypothetical protein
MRSRWSADLLSSHRPEKVGNCNTNSAKSCGYRKGVTGVRRCFHNRIRLEVASRIEGYDKTGVNRRCSIMAKQYFVDKAIQEAKFISDRIGRNCELRVPG